MTTKRGGYLRAGDTVKMKQLQATIQWQVIITREDLIKLVKCPPDAKITITVPSGADWSGMELDIDEIGGVAVTWAQEK